MDDQVKLAILQQRVDDIKPLLDKLDVTIEKLSEVNTTVSRMLAVHEERLSKSEEIDSVLFAKIDEMFSQMNLKVQRSKENIERQEKEMKEKKLEMEEAALKQLDALRAQTIIDIEKEAEEKRIKEINLRIKNEIYITLVL